MAEIGLDRSKWQGPATAAQVAAQVAAGVRFVGIKASQGGTGRDATFAANVAAYKDSGILLFPYHFVTNDNAIQQYDNFMGALSTVDYTWRLPPALDCEAFTAPARIPLLGGLLGAYPSSSIVWYMAGALREEMSSWPGLAGFDWPMIYTNASSGNVIFKDAKFAQLPLWVANWRVTAPYLPNVWRANGKYIIWQDNVVDGAPYGIDGQVDHDVWGNLMPFPDGSDPEPPDPEPTDPPAYYDLTLTDPDGVKYAGRVSRE